MKSIQIARDIDILGDKALFFRKQGLAVVADLHLGYEGVLQREGIIIPRRQKVAILDALSRIIDNYSPETLIVNGDFKHSFSQNLEEEWQEVKEVLSFLREQTDLIVVRGNHDNFLGSILRDMDIELRKSYTACGYTFVHGHWPLNPEGGVVIGHEHPALRLRDSIGATLTLPAFVVGKDFTILPAFSPLAQGVDIASYPYLSPILNNYKIGDARVFGVDEKEGILDFGNVDELKKRNALLAMR